MKRFAAWALCLASLWGCNRSSEATVAPATTGSASVLPSQSAPNMPAAIATWIAKIQAGEFPNETPSIDGLQPSQHQVVLNKLDALLDEIATAEWLAKTEKQLDASNAKMQLDVAPHQKKRQLEACRNDAIRKVITFMLTIPDDSGRAKVIQRALSADETMQRAALKALVGKWDGADEATRSKLEALQAKLIGSPPKVAIGKVSVTGGELADAEKVIAAKEEALLRCYTTSLRIDLKPAWQTTLTATVNAKGVVEKVTGDTPEAASDCLAGVLKNIQFSANDKNPVVVSIPLTFTPPGS